MDTDAKNLDFLTIMPHPARQAPVPLFFLYGEAPRGVGPRFLHLEPLEDRSRPTDWTIRPHTHANLHHMLLITGGGGVMRVDDISLAFAAPCLLSVPAGTVHSFAFEPETRGQVLTLADAYLDDIAAREPSFMGLFAHAECLSHTDTAAMRERLDELAGELVWRAPGHAAAIESHLLGLLVQLVRLRARANTAVKVVPGRAAVLVARFRALLELNYRGAKTVGAYAGTLGVTPATLRRACLAVAGAPPVGLIQQRQYVESQRILLYTNMSVNEAAQYLGFRDSAYFSRFFAKYAGCSPRGFRQPHGSGQPGPHRLAGDVLIGGR